MHFTNLYEHDTLGRAYDRRLLRRFLPFLRPYTATIILTLLVLPLAVASRLAQPYLLKVAIDSYILPGQLAGLPRLALFYFLLLLVESALTFLQVYLLTLVGQRVMHDIRLRLFDHLQSRSPRFFDRTATGTLVTRLTSDVEALGEMFSAGIITVVGDILLLLGIVGIMLWLNPTLSLVTFSLLPLLIYVAFLFRRRMRSAFREVRSRLAVMNGFLAESIGGMAIVQLYNRQRDEQERFSALNAAHRDASLPAIGWDASLFALVEALSSVAIGLIIWYGGGKIVAGLLTFGALVAFIQYTEKFFTPIRDLSGKYSVMQGAMASLERIFQLLDNEEAEPQGPAADEAVVPPPLASIEFRDVSFAYRPGEPVLRSLDFAIRRGETVALVGETGGGKTTVTRLLCRLYDPDNGCILLNGIDIRHLPLQELRRRCAVVLQEPYLFSGSIADNISLGDPGAAARMEHAAIAVGADRFIRRLPGGFYEPVRERGSNFSAGERQLISFARAIAFDPELLILDEATASVDPASERLIRKGLARLLAGRTALVIAHRLTTIRHADRIIVIEGGEKVEEGGHQDLLARHGAYARLYNLQFRHGQANRSPF